MSEWREGLKNMKNDVKKWNKINKRELDCKKL